ncbi:MBL fold metallo-hydrolase [Phenylobacterium hankyongense]|uniref:MBL fold metallo-hydrolase n=1 Tax=Phenylobacterium hankyongense TaxID=1813876 RepID=A0A328B2I7_9CAUL|nr:MBL fold metallo-hydrolase [Phenylobacterium hankyongense]RAK60651.1 MBL fold metallo-hydrolase [Phenylobacterium hankyongense]
MKALRLAVLCGALSLAGAAQAAEKPLTVVMVDVDGGAATLFVTPEGKSLLVDTGWPAGMGVPRPAPGATAPPQPTSAERIVAAAAKLGVRKIDYLLITHYHVDHIGGLQGVMARMPVGTFLDHGVNREETPPDTPPAMAANLPASFYPGYLKAIAGHPHRVVKPGDKVQIGSLALTFVAADATLIPAPPHARPGPGPECVLGSGVPQVDENPRSAGFVASYGKARILDLADLTLDQEKQLVCPANRLGRVDVLLVSHHGTALSTGPALLAATAPRVALMANGSRKGGDKEVFENLAAARSKPAVWQLHGATRSPETNRPADYIANPLPTPDGFYAVTALVSPNGAVRVTNARNGFSETYPGR